MKRTYDDVLLKPQKCIVESRSEIDLRTQLVRDIWINIPIVSAPMSSVTEWQMACAMGENGGFGFIHRFMSVDENIYQYEKAVNYLQPKKYGERTPEVGCTLGITEGYERLEKLYDSGCRIFCIDVAHAYSAKMEEFVDGIDKAIRIDSSFVVGNVATVEAALFLRDDLNIDAIKVGIGPGAACRTREVTGFGYPQLSAVQEIYEAVGVTVPIIADGGIKTSGDIVKALAAGASSVMLGRLLAGAEEAPEPGEYYGMAAARINGHHAPEGSEGKVELNGDVKSILDELVWGIRSGISYGGGTDIYSLQDNAEFIEVSQGTLVESSIRI